MPVHKAGKNGWQWGTRGKKYGSRKKALAQGAAAVYSGYREGGKSKEEMLKDVYSGKG